MVDAALTIHTYPAAMEQANYASIAIERINKEFLKQLRSMNRLTNMDASEKVIYLQCTNFMMCMQNAPQLESE
ncbi:hypothetical protein ACX1C1_17210 [Paenibacillus sp. strain BS8-2]